jgi:hypothetical protein
MPKLKSAVNNAPPVVMSTSMSAITVSGGDVRPPQSEDIPVADENDEIEQVIDVFLSPELAEQLHLLQYPLTQLQRPSTSSSASVVEALSRPSEGRVKPLHGQLQLEVPLPENMEHEGSYAFVGNRRVFASQTIPIQTHLCLGKLRPAPHGATR